jgi:hypothetical protein
VTGKRAGHPARQKRFTGQPLGAYCCPATASSPGLGMVVPVSQIDWGDLRLSPTAPDLQRSLLVCPRTVTAPACGDQRRQRPLALLAGQVDLAVVRPLVAGPAVMLGLGAGAVRRWITGLPVAAAPGRADEPGRSWSRRRPPMIPRRKHQVEAPAKGSGKGPGGNPWNADLRPR